MKTTIRAAAMLLVASLYCGRTPAAQLDGYLGLEPSPVTASEANLLVPPRDGGPVVVRASFRLQDINEINDEAETFEFNGVLTLRWQDKRQAFDPQEAKVSEKIYQGNYQFSELAPAWYPQVVLANESGLYEKHALLLRVKPDGTNVLVETINAAAKADLNLRRYPFDSQRLEAAFEILGFDTSEVVLKAAPLPAASETQEIRIPEWKLTGLRALTREQVNGQGLSSTFVLAMDVKRQSLYMLRLVVLPLALIVMLSWSVFWMDRSTLGDRINVSFIGILTAVAYQIVVSEILPQISYVTLMNGFLNLSFWIMCATVVVNLIVGASDKQGNSERGDRIDCRCRWMFPLAYVGLLSVAVAIAFVFF